MHVKCSTLKYCIAKVKNCVKVQKVVNFGLIIKNLSGLHVDFNSIYNGLFSESLGYQNSFEKEISITAMYKPKHFLECKRRNISLSGYKR